MISKNIIITPNFTSKSIARLNLVFFAEGFLENEEYKFWNLLQDFSQRICKNYPFSLLKQYPGICKIYGCFDASTTRSIQPRSSFTSGRNNFDTHIDNNSNKLIIDESKLLAHINESGVYYGDSDFITAVNDGKFIQKDNYLFIILLQTEEQQGISYEFESVADAPLHYIAFSTTNYWEQYVIHSLGKLLGLANEFEKETPDFLAPEEYQHELISWIYPNLLCKDDNSPSKIMGNKWFPYISNTALSLQLDSIENIKDYNRVDTQIPEFNYSTEGIQLAEGGGGYRKGVFRVANDCLLRRKFGSTELPIAATSLSFCTLCENHIANLIFREHS